MNGKVKWFSRNKGYGFIAPYTGGNDIFVHWSAIDGDGYRNLYEGQHVQFDTYERKPGALAAQNVRVVRRW